MPILTRLFVADGTWDAFQADWERQCVEFGENLDSYNPLHIPMLKDAAASNDRRSGAFGLELNGAYAAACQLNCTLLPGYNGPVLRLRFLTLSPRQDLGSSSVDDYEEILMSLLSGVFEISDTELPADHVKFHLASPADRTFFAALGKPLGASGAFENVCVKGSWLYITKSKP